MGASRFGRSARRRVIFLLAVATLAASMLIAVRRSSEARQLSRELQTLERAEDVARADLASAMVRADSLASRPRMLAAAGAIGLRPIRETEFEWLGKLPRHDRVALDSDGTSVASAGATR